MQGGIKSTDISRGTTPMVEIQLDAETFVYFSPADKACALGIDNQPIKVKYDCAKRCHDNRNSNTPPAIAQTTSKTKTDLKQLIRGEEAFQLCDRILRTI